MGESTISRYYIDTLWHTDVLLGRGVGTNRRAGNVYFREIVSQHVDEYLASTKTHKMEITRSVIDHIHALNPPGRFLEKDEVTGSWRECDNKRAHEKTAQALRDGASRLRNNKRPISDEKIKSIPQLSRPAKKQRNDIERNYAGSPEPFTINLPINEEEEGKEKDIEALIAETELYSPIFSCATSAASSAASVSPSCPISPCPSASSSQCQSENNRKDSFAEMFGGLPFHFVDCHCQENKIALMGGSVSLDGMVDMQDEDIVLLWLTC